MDQKRIQLIIFDQNRLKGNQGNSIQGVMSSRLFEDELNTQPSTLKDARKFLNPMNSTDQSQSHYIPLYKSVCPCSVWKITFNERMNR